MIKRKLRIRPGSGWILTAMLLSAIFLAACGNDDTELNQLLDDATAYVNTPGVKNDVPPSHVAAAGWNVCYSDTYDVTGVSLTTILGGCGGTQLMLACRRVGDTNYALLAHAPKVDVTFDTTTDTTTTHLANGVAWYYNSSHSWGFAVPGDGVSKSSCDTATGSYPGQRLCWHTGSGFINGGWRCGGATGLNSDPTWQRIILTKT